MGLNFLCVGEYIMALLRIDPRESIKQAALEAQGDGRLGLEDGLACFLDVNFLDLLPRYLSVLVSKTEGGHQPGNGQGLLAFAPNAGKIPCLPDGSHAVHVAGEN